MLLPTRLHEMHVSHREGYTASPAVRPMGAGAELLGRRKDGSEFPVEISLSPVEAGSDTFVSSVIRDVTERRQMEQEIRDAHAEADRANKANTAFLAAASHDLRQPVQALHLLNGALKRTVKDPRALQMIESQDHSLDGMTNLLNSLLDISRLDAGAVTPELEDFSMRRMIDRLSAEFSRQAIQKGLQFEVESSNIIVRSDPNLLGEIMQNFVSNAIRYTDKGKVQMKCTVDGDRLCLAVSDTGIGIEPEQFEAIFKEFHQCKTPGSTKEGFGLGLAIVRRLADLLEHELAVASTPGEGSCFSLYLPIVKSEVTVPEQEEVGKREYKKASGMIYLIEDDFAVADAWGMLLEAEGYQVATAQSALEVDALLEHFDTKPDLVISDYHLLHKTTGVQAIRRIREKIGKEVPAFIVTGDTSKVTDEARTLSNVAIMCKPVSIDQLLDMARKALASGIVSEE
jgi:signal transduction histidine kinase/CheY-like chemotaxis protein